MIGVTSPEGLALLLLVGAIASGINAVAGGGTLITFPTLTVAMQVPSVVANATNSVGLWPGSLASAFGFWNLASKARAAVLLLLGPTIAGSIAGAFLLVATSQRTFDLMIPALILLATLTLAFQKRIKAIALAGGKSPHPWIGTFVQFLVSVYGGYFGAGMGIMMLGSFAVTLEGDIHEMNAVKNWLAVAINVVATVVFLAQGLVLLVPALALAFGAILGGYLAAKWSRRVESESLRKGIVVYGLLMAAYFAYRVVI